jgi:microcystin-dependent protein
VADPFVAEIRIFPFNFAPKGWAWCNGQLLPISQNTALFALLGTVYGGDGKSTFALPDLEGAAPVHPDDSTFFLGAQGGVDSVTLLGSEMPVHSHGMRGQGSDPADVKIVNPNASFGVSQGGTLYQTTQNASLAPQAATPTGGSLPHNNLMPYLTFYFNIALQGVFPPRG